MSEERNDENLGEHLERIYKALEIILRLAATALADASALEVQVKGAGLLDEGFEALRRDLRADILAKLRQVFEGDREDLLRRLRDFEGTIQ